ncbi:hypothetical protein HID58_033484 [Brassica napus]|uniref:Uncharacterized protein n=1 Tax=Brassica napus TaxID=3708 RepID=A0ABQ8C0K6_BRANA|nr:hypothetical protein HID58_033484 [Brassica napus]
MSITKLPFDRSGKVNNHLKTEEGGDASAEVRGRETQKGKREARRDSFFSLLRRSSSSLPLHSGTMESTEAPSVAVVKSQVVEDAIGSTADVSQPPSHEVDSLRVAGCSDGVVVVSEIPCLTPSDDDFDHGEDRDQDHGDNDDVVVVVPKEDELKQKIIRQAISFDLLSSFYYVEYYFSDENLPTDKFLLNAMKKNKKGFVPISTIATFHKMKKLTRDHALIVSALKESSFLVVSSDEKKVKRLSPLPEIRDPKIFTVLVENLPEDHTDENIRAIFGKAGRYALTFLACHIIAIAFGYIIYTYYSLKQNSNCSIKSVSICDPNAVEESEKGCKKDKFIRTRLHAFVEYESVEAAEKAAATLNNEQDWRNGLRVKLLEQTGKFAQRRPGRKEVDTVKDNTGQVHDQIGGEENKKSNEHQHHRHHHSDTPADNIVLLNHFQDSGDKNGNKTKSRGRGRRQNNQGGNGHGSSPSTSSSLHHNYHHHHVEVSKPPPGPRMPDGTRGFTLGRGKPLPAPTSAQTSHEA